MKNKNIVKITLDTIMTILVILMYNKRVISMKFHEVGGLIAMGIFVIHVGLNFNWVKSISKRIFSKNLPVKTRIGYIVNVLLLLAMGFIGLSGVLISKTILTGISSQSIIWKIGHQSVAGFALILVGIHLGLHWGFIKAMFGKVIKIPKSAAKPLGIVCMAAVIVFGTYSIFTSSFTRWISMPVKVLSGNGPVNGPGTKQGEKNMNQNRQGQGHEASSGSNSGTAGNGENNKGSMQEQGGGKGSGQGGAPAMGNSSISITNILKVIATYLSIVSLFGIITYNIEKIFKRRKTA